jgi:hypothetical protein
MDRDVALRIDAILVGVRASLDAVAHYVKNNASEDEFKIIAHHIGASMGQTILVSNMLYERHADIIPEELK